MDKVHVIYGSTTGMTEAVAGKIAAWVETLKAAL